MWRSLRRSRRKATTLLKNSGTILPLSASSAGTIAVIGPSASASPTYAGGGSAYVIPSGTVTPLAGIQAAAGSGTSVVYSAGPADRYVAAVHPVVRPVPRLLVDAVRRQLHRHADCARDRHLRAGPDQPVRLLYLDVPVAERAADHRRPEHAAGAHLLGRGPADRRAAVHAVDQRPVVAAAVGHAVGARARHQRRGQRRRSQHPPRWSSSPTTPNPRPPTGRR